MVSWVSQGPRGQQSLVENPVASSILRSHKRQPLHFLTENARRKGRVIVFTLRKKGVSDPARSGSPAEDITVAICGSYNKHLKEMAEKVRECRRLGTRVLIPRYASAKRSEYGFVYLRGEHGTPRELQERNFIAIETSTFVLIVNPRGYIGPSTAMEIGYAYAKGVPIYCTDEPVDYTFRFFTIYGKQISEIKAAFLKEKRVLSNSSAGNYAR